MATPSSPSIFRKRSGLQQDARSVRRLDRRIGLKLQQDVLVKQFRQGRVLQHFIPKALRSLGCRGVDEENQEHLAFFPGRVDGVGIVLMPDGRGLDGCLRCLFARRDPLRFGVTRLFGACRARKQEERPKTV